MKATAGVLPGAGNRYDRAEWAGAFGDLGTLLPFVLAYIAVLGMDPRSPRRRRRR